MKITKTKLRQMIKESITKKAQSDENLQEFFGMFGGKKKAQPKAKAGSSGGSKYANDLKMLKKIWNNGKRVELSHYLPIFLEDPEAYLKAVKLAHKGIKGARDRNWMEMERYLEYIEPITKRYLNSSYVTGKGPDPKDPMGDLAVRFTQGDPHTGNPDARNLDAKQKSRFRDRAGDFASALSLYAKDNMDPSLNYLVQKAEDPIKRG